MTLGQPGREIAAMLKTIHASEDIAAAREKAIRTSPPPGYATSPARHGRPRDISI
jgi:hypothetical protein